MAHVHILYICTVLIATGVYVQCEITFPLPVVELVAIGVVVLMLIGTSVEEKRRKIIYKVIFFIDTRISQHRLI